MADLDFGMNKKSQRLGVIGVCPIRSLSRFQKFPNQRDLSSLSSELHRKAGERQPVFVSPYHRHS
jgi:hypothetical protein